ncbi:MAG: rod shape-determining protein RodA [Bacteroidales bacterium]
MMSPRSNTRLRVNWSLILIYIALVFIGWINIYAAVYSPGNPGIFSLSHNAGKQLLWIGTAAVIIFVVMIIDAKFYSAVSFLVWLGVMGLLVAVLLFGKEIAGSRSWFQIGGFSLQPSEFAKTATALALASFLSRKEFDPRKWINRLGALAIFLLPAGLILLQHDTGSAMVFSAFFLVLFREGLSGKLLILVAVSALLFLLALLINKFILIGILAGLLVLLIAISKNLRKRWLILAAGFLILSGYIFSVDYAFENVLQPHQKKRINVLLGIENDIHGAGYNVHQSKIAIGSGGFSGKGYLKGTQTKFDFVPEQSTDFIFCTVGEEWGFLGSAVVILLFFALIVRIVMAAENQRSAFSRIYGYGVASVLLFHFAVNIGMTIGLFPVIGIPLPFVSYGGSSLWGFTLMLFIFIRLDASRLELL